MPNPSYARADDVTPDGKIIVGSMDCRGLTKKAWPMVSPVIWVLNEATGKYEFSLMPEPEKDITAVTLPQQVTATSVSADGKTVLGQVTEFSGLLNYQIVYRQSENGEWKFETPDAHNLIKEGAVWPEYPVRPTKPKLENYITQDEIKAYNQANQAYQDSLEIVSLTGIRPKMPFPEDFLKERKEEYEADMDKYQTDSETYLTMLRAFQSATIENITNTVFNFKSQILSNNGKYYGANYIYSGPADPVDPTKVPTYVSPMILNLEERDGGWLYYHPSTTLFSICDDGTMIGCTPSNDSYIYAREPYVITPGNDVPVLFVDWVKGKSSEAAEWLAQNISYDLSAADSPSGRDEEGYVMAGSVRLTPDATKAIGYLCEPKTYKYISYIIDFTAKTDGIASVGEDAALSVYEANGTLHFAGNPASVEIYDLSGRCVYAGTPAETLDMAGAKGVYIVKLVGAQGTHAQKIALK